MNSKLRIFIGIVALVLFAEMTMIAYNTGWGFFSLALANPASQLMAVELDVALALIGVWMWRDARSHGMSALPYIGAMLLVGPVAPLVYLVRRPDESREERENGALGDHATQLA